VGKVRMNDDIVIENLCVNFSTEVSGVGAVENISITFYHDAVTGVVGESGSGKSVLGMSILQLLPSSAKVTGRCVYKNRNLYTLNQEEIRKVRSDEIGLIAQNPKKSLNPVLTVGRQLREPLTKLLGHTSESANNICIEYLTSFGFDNPKLIMKSYPFQLSGGMNQRVLSIMGLICHPDWIIADEPTKGLDAVLRKSVFEVLQKIKKQYTKNMIIITHDLGFAKAISDYIAVFYKGEMIEWGKSQDIFKTPKHPYTRSLIASMPQNGMVAPRMCLEEDHESKCKFYSKCDERVKACLYSDNKMAMLDDGRQVRCCIYD
jgi:peptide/nickel transport system ATP-binding protein